MISTLSSFPLSSYWAKAAYTYKTYLWMQKRAYEWKNGVIIHKLKLTQSAPLLFPSLSSFCGERGNMQFRKKRGGKKERKTLSSSPTSSFWILRVNNGRKRKSSFFYPVISIQIAQKNEIARREAAAVQRNLSQLAFIRKKYCHIEPPLFCSFCLLLKQCHLPSYCRL